MHGRVGHLPHVLLQEQPVPPFWPRGPVGPQRQQDRQQPGVQQGCDLLCAETPDSKADSPLRMANLTLTLNGG